MKFYIILIVSLLWHVSFAQFNDSTHHYVNYASTGVINKTNDGNSYLLNNNLKFNVSKKDVSINTTNSWIYGKQQNILSNNDFSTSADFNLFKTLQHFYYWGLANYDKSYSLKINNRLQTGLGIGYSILDREKSVLVISDGILYEKNDLYATSAEFGSNQYETLRNSLRIKYKFIIKDIIVIDGADFLQQSLSCRSDYIIKSNTTLSIKLKKWLSLTAAVVYNKLNRTQRENLLINYGLSIEQYF